MEEGTNDEGVGLGRKIGLVTSRAIEEGRSFGIDHGFYRATSFVWL